MVDKILVQPDPKRDAAAAELVKSAHTWPIVTLKQEYGAFPRGTAFLAAPGSSGRRWLCNTVVCECPDYRRSFNVCKHVRAAILLDEQERAKQPRRGYTELFPTCFANGCDDDPEPGESFCWRHVKVEATV